MFDVVILVGYLGKDPELRYSSKSTKPYCFLSLATEGFYSREKDPETKWHNIIAWDKTAERCAEKYGKGTLLVVKGAIKYMDRVDDNGKRSRTTEIVASEVRCLVRKDPAGKGEDAGPETNKEQEDEVSPDFDDEIPF